MYRRLLMSLFLLAIMLFFIPIQTSAEENSLQQIIDGARPGEVVLLPAGDFSGALVIQKPIHLIGKPNTVIKGSPVENVVTIIGTTDVIIENITIEDGGTAVNKAGILIKNSKNIQIENVTIQESYHGIYSLSSTDSSFMNNTISGSSAHFSKKGNGIYLYETKRIKIDSNTIMNVQDGLYIEEDEQTVITGNTVTESRYGMHFMYSADEEVTGNLLQNNITGLMVMMTSGVSIVDNKMIDHIDYKGTGVIFYNVEDAMLSENVIQNNSVGVSLQSSKETHILSNQLLNNQIGLTLLANDESNLFSLNTMSGNIMQVKSDPRHSILTDNGVGNYWDDYTGLDLDGDGVGDTPYIPTSTYAYLVGSQPVFQYFFEAPATVLMNQFDHQLVVVEEEKVRDDAPIVGREAWVWEGFTPSYPTIVTGFILVALGFIIRRKVVM